MKTNLLKSLWLILAFVCFGFGAAGVILPVLPTTPFLLLASFCFAKGSKKFHLWFQSTKLYQKHLDGFVKERTMLLKTKVCILLPVSVMLICAMVLMENVFGRMFLIFLILFKYTYFFTRIKTVR
ncbi:YbaN family protein [Mediterraneibacter sp.]|jgi:uncharacterized membrane protein YbaN (DUF454 family)|uniref:YbaN family protein n=1 Tax=Mediterraneibacter sp. TaxID=2316022 RepID=UPI0015B1622B|nr:YbaN family protein [Mediterraneibacter sp.]